MSIAKGDRLFHTGFSCRMLPIQAILKGSKDMKNIGC